MSGSSPVSADGSPTLQHQTRIEPRTGWSSLDLHELWEYKDLLYFYIIRNVKGRYRQMALGPLWIVIQPLMQMVLFTIVFGKVAKLPSENIPYPIFTYCAIIPWMFFANACKRSVGSLRTQMGVISKVYFPRLIMPLATTAGAFIDFLISLVILFGMLIAYGYWPGIEALMLVPLVLMAAMAGIGLGLWGASLAVRFRDVTLAAGHGLRFAKFLTPVAYTATLVPDRFQWLYKLNPMYWVTDGFRWALLGKGNGPEPYMLIPVAIVLVVFVSGMYVFRRTERSIVDLL